jgi:ATP:ADP antiporter, AAA family
MSWGLSKFFRFFLAVEPNERLKVLFLSLSFFLIIGSYTVVRTLKDSLFISIVGAEYWAVAKGISIIALIPAILLFSRIVDLLRRHQMLYLYIVLYGVGGLIIAYFLGDPVIGLLNTETSKYRLFGWIIYLFIEGYNPFVVSLFWSFTHTITAPDAAKANYPLIVAGSKMGGIIISAFACWVLSCPSTGMAQRVADTYNHQILLAVCSILLLIVPLFVYLLMTLVPGRYLHGYEAAYQLEKQREHEVVGKGRLHALGRFFYSIFSGLILLLRYPYVMGIFGVIFFWEVVGVFINYERLSTGQRLALCLSDQTRYLLQLDMYVHMVGVIITLVGTRALIQLLGERRSLIVVPVATGALVMYYLTAQMTDQSATIMAIVFVLMRSINYAFASPLRESLYIPTTKEMKFKSKSWIDAFGVKIAKGVGAAYSSLVVRLTASAMFSANMIFFTLIFALWTLTAHLLGRRYEQTVENNEVIGD